MKNVPHESAKGHVTGTAEYIDDRPSLHGEVLVDVIFSPHAKAEIKKIDLTKITNQKGILAIYSASDFATNIWGSIEKDQPFLADKMATYHGEPILIIAAQTREDLRFAKKNILITYKELPAILNIEQAIEKNSFMGPVRTIERGNLQDAKKNSSHVIENSLKIEGQDHFYLESQAALAYPLEDDQIHVYSSTQHPSEVQHVVAQALGIPYKNVICTVKRMGGGFGGKESQAGPFAVYASLVAHKLKTSARIILSKDDDMIITGGRHPFLANYTVGFEQTGRITFLQVELFSDGGAYLDLSPSIMERAMLHVDNAYFLPNVKIVGKICKTNLSSNTAYRGFGGPQGAFVIENIMEEIARSLKLDPLLVREKNIYRDKNITTPYGQTLEFNPFPQIFEQLKTKCRYQERRKEIEKFNQSSPTQLRGISLTAVKFGISFTSRFLNQANALVNLHLDGTFQVSTGATEMGQGSYTKIAQIVAECFDLSVDQVRVLPTSTDKNHNTSPSAASAETDLNGMAAFQAAENIRNRLSQFAKFFLNEKLDGVKEFNLESSTKHPDIEFKEGNVLDIKTKRSISFKDLVKNSYYHRLNLGEYVHYKTPGIFFDKLKGQGNPFLYFTNGVACSEVLIDRFTGEVKVEQTDILMDIGRAINEGIDLGQVWGGFIQGLGWVTTEKLFYQEGVLKTHSPSTYKIPSIQDIPRRYSIELIDNKTNLANVRASKATGEPPFLLCISVWTAIKDALHFFCEPGKSFQLTSPATSEEVLMKMHQLTSSHE